MKIWFVVPKVVMVIPKSYYYPPVIFDPQYPRIHLEGFWGTVVPLLIRQLCVMTLL